MNKNHSFLTLRIVSEVTTDRVPIELRVKVPCKVTIDKEYEWVKFGGIKKFQLSKINEESAVKVLTDLREVCLFADEEQKYAIVFNGIRNANIILIGAEEHEEAGYPTSVVDPYNEDDL